MVVGGKNMNSIVDFLKEHWVWTSAVAFIAFTVSALTVVGSVGSGIGVLVDLKNWIAPPNQETVIPVDAELQLINVDSSFGIEAGTDSNDNIHIVNMSAIIKNPDSTPVYLTVDRIESNLGDDKCLPDASNWQIMELNKGINISLDACSIRTVILPGQFTDGRIDWTIKFGLQRDKLDQIMRIKGSIRVSLANGRKLFTWLPDGDSVHPSGMKAMVVPTS